MWPSRISLTRRSRGVLIKVLFRSVAGMLQDNELWWRQLSRWESQAPVVSCPNRVSRDSRARTVYQTKVVNVRADTHQQARNERSRGSTLRQPARAVRPCQDQIRISCLR